MIDHLVFAEGMGLLVGAYPRTLDAAVSRAYYVVLNARLDNASFMRAVYTHLSTEDWWPSPVKLVEKAQGGSDLDLAAEALRTATALFNLYGGPRYMPRSVYDSLDDGTKAGISAAGGPMELCSVTPERYASLLKRFTRGFLAATHPSATLPAAPASAVAVSDLDGNVARLVASIATTRTSPVPPSIRRPRSR